MPFPEFEPCFPVFWRETLAKHASRTFVVLGEQRVTYADADARSARLARALASSGVGKGTRVGLLFPNGPDWLTAWLATARIGALAVPINTFQPPRELGWMLRHADIDTLLTCDSLLGNDLLERIEGCAGSLSRQSAGGGRLALAELPYLRQVVVWGDGARSWATGVDEFLARAETIQPALLAEIEAEVRPADAMLIIYSSGSTAEPKGAIHSHGAVIRHAFNLNTMRDVCPGDVVYSPMPFFWVGGVVFVLVSAMHLGATLLCEDRFEPGETLALLERERATVVMGWPHFAKALAEHPSFPERDLSSIRTGNLYDVLPEDRRVPDPELRSNSLGMTESCGPHTFDRMDIDLPESLRGSFGRSVDGVSHKVVDPETGAPIGPNEPGEIYVRGYSLMQGLYKREREEVFEPDGYYRTGDGGRFDAEGHLYFEGRLGELIKTAGANVTPREVELVLEGLDGVREAFVVGVSHPDRGENVAATVVLAEGVQADSDSLRASLKRELSAYKLPRHWWLADSEDLPMTDSGKIDKRRLRDTLESRIASGEIA
jgi:acyl-CoA synthetase (AMP-forming)/AMP-acid ligase II